MPILFYLNILETEEMLQFWYKKILDVRGTSFQRKRLTRLTARSKHQTSSLLRLLFRCYCLADPSVCPRKAHGWKTGKPRWTSFTRSYKRLKRKEDRARSILYIERIEFTAALRHFVGYYPISFDKFHDRFSNVSPVDKAA